MKKILVLFLFLFFSTKSFALIEVDITRGNLNPLPIAVSPLSIDENSRKEFEKVLKKKNIWSKLQILALLLSFLFKSFMAFMAQF